MSSLDGWQKLLDGERDELRAHLEDEGDIMRVTNITDFEVTLEDANRNISHVHKQGDGKWKCQRCDRYRCEHVKFVQVNNVQLLPKKPVKADDVDILTF